MIRTRFAPSPTGFLHVGGLRTCLYNYLFARKNGGTFILRIEDTDQKRYVEGALENLLKTLFWCGLEYDEGPAKDGKFGPYIQSERTEIYRKYALELVEKNEAYYCFCTPECLDAMRERQSVAKQAPMYDRTCLQLSNEEVEAKKKEGIPFVIRQKIPQGEKLFFIDLIRGRVTFDTSNIDDQVLMKSDNFPTYHLANVVDDHLMQITNVIRGEEWLPSTPKHILLYRALGWTPPEFAHVPLLLNKDKSKLSKRQGDVSVEDYIKKGYTIEALINFIALLGWHPGEGIEEEIFSLEDLIKNFSIEKVHKAGAIFDIEKLNWFNFQWKRKLHNKKLEKLAHGIDPAAGIQTNERGVITYRFSHPESEKKFELKRADMLISLCGSNISRQWLENDIIGRALITVEDKVLKSPEEIANNIECFFLPKEATLELILNPKMKVDDTVAKTAVNEGLKFLEQLSPETFESLEKLHNELFSLAQKLSLKNGQLLWPLRVALTGEQFSPGVFELLWTLGKKESLSRIERTSKNLFQK